MLLALLLGRWLPPFFYLRHLMTLHAIGCMSSAIPEPLTPKCQRPPPGRPSIGRGRGLGGGLVLLVTEDAGVVGHAAAF